MKPTKAELIERHEQLLKLDDVLTEHEKTKHFAMSHYQHETPCGTSCCLVGFAATQKWFMERGITIYRLRRFDEDLTDDFFGDGAWNEMFTSGLSAIWPEAMQRVRDRLERIKAMPEEQA